MSVIESPRLATGDNVPSLRPQRAPLGDRLAQLCHMLGLRAFHMAGAWLAVGAVVGACNGLHLGGRAPMMAGQIVAGMIVYPCLGALLALIADSAVESLAGATFGLLVGAVALGLGGRWPHFDHLAFTTTVGALIGATCLPWVRLTLRAAGFVVRSLWFKRETPIQS